MYVLLTLFITYIAYVIYHNIKLLIKSENTIFFKDSHAKEIKKLKLYSRENVSLDTIIFRFNLPKGCISGLPVCKHIKVFAPISKLNKPTVENEWNGQQQASTQISDVDTIQRKYNPISKYEDPFIELLIKVYKGDSNSKFPDGGRMSQYLNQLQVGDYIDIAGPFGSYEYISPGILQSGTKIIQFSKLGLIAGGTGITPMLQIITQILEAHGDSTQINLIFANKMEDDILMRDEIDMLANIHPSQFKVWYTLNNPPEKWEYDTGHVTQEMIHQHLPEPHPSTTIFSCGPPMFVEHACKANLTKLGYSNSYSW